MKLTFQNTQRTETDDEIIRALKRKGWVENNPPFFNPLTQHAPAWDGVQWVITDKTPAEIAAASRKTWTSSEFLALFTTAETLAFVTACQQTPELDVIRLKLTTTPTLESDSPNLQAGMSALVTAGILTEARKLEILNT